MVNAYTVWLGLFCYLPVFYSLFSLLYSWSSCKSVYLDSCFYEEFCYHHQSLLPELVSCSRDLQRKWLTLLHLPAHFSHSSWTCTWQPFTPPEHLLKKQTNTARSYWTHLGLSGSAPGYIWKVIFSSCLSALLYFIPALSKQSTLWFLSPVWA